MSNLPDGYTAHDGGACPLDGQQLVDCIIRTGQTDESGAKLLGHSGVMRAKLNDWVAANHPDGIGAVLGYLAFDGPAENESVGIDLLARWPESI